MTIEITEKRTLSNIDLRIFDREQLKKLYRCIGESKDQISIGNEVSWVSYDGSTDRGKVIDVEDDLAKVECGMEQDEMWIQRSKLTKVES